MKDIFVVNRNRYQTTAAEYVSCTMVAALYKLYSLPPPLPRAPQVGTVDCVIPFQPINCNLPRSALSVQRSISAMQIKTSTPPVSVVRPYNFPPLPATPSKVESLESKSPEDGSFFASFKDPAQHKARSTSPSFLDELQQAFPLLRQESKVLTSLPPKGSIHQKNPNFMK